jgi:hypothetical protein
LVCIQIILSLLKNCRLNTLRVISAIKKFVKGSAAGPSGLSPDHFKQLLFMPNNQHDLCLLEATTLFANSILSGKGHPLEQLRKVYYTIDHLLHTMMACHGFVAFATEALHVASQSSLLAVATFPLFEFRFKPSRVRTSKLYAFPKTS